MSAFLQAAKEYRRLGLHPIPVEPRGKKPLARWQDYMERQPSEEELDRWWTNVPDANVALVMGRGMFAVDIDGPDGEAALALDGVVFPASCPINETGKGRHVFFAGDYGNAVGLLPHVDVRGNGGYVVVGPSIHPSGAVYRWVREMLPVSLLPEPPDALRKVLARPKTAEHPAAGEDWLTLALGGVTEGGRDVTCTRIAGYLWRKGLPQDAIDAFLQVWASRCSPPFPSEEVTKCVESIAKREGGPAIPEGLPPAACDIVPSTLQFIRAPRRVLRTGLKQVDARLDGGVEPATVTLLAGLPGAGKTAMALQIARESMAADIGVLFLTLEMAPTRLMRRMLSQESGVRFKNIKTGVLVDAEQTLLARASSRIERMPLWIETRIDTVEALDEVLGRFVPGRIGLVVIDYLQRLRGPNGNDRYAEVSHVSRALTSLAQTRDLPIIALSSLNRPVGATSTWRPSLRNLRDSGQLEYDGDNVLMLYREDSSEQVEVHLKKQRDGESGVVDYLRWRGEVLTFEDAA